MIATNILSKSQYIKGKQCFKALWYSYHRWDLLPETDTEAETRFESGREVGELAHQLFPGGLLIDCKPWEIEKSIKDTKQLIQSGIFTLYEAAALAPDGAYARIDILEKSKTRPDHWNLIEVKSSTSVKDSHLDDFDKEFSALGISFQDILKILPQATGSIQVLSVNMKGGKLEYAKHREEGLHVIAIGGLALSRGLTLEDLTISYILRNTMASDTLMQMARWFGYRDGFEDICRLYLPEISRKHYKYVHEAIEELRTEVNRMQLLELTPEHFGLRVRESDLGIKITAANKMRTASKFTVAEDYSARHVEGHSLPNDNSVNQNNFSTVEKFIKNLGSPAQSENKEDPKLLWFSVPGDQIISLIRNFHFSETHADLGLISADSSLFLDYVSDRLKADLAFWDVAVPQLLKGVKDIDFAGHSVVLRTRLSGTVKNNTYYVTGDASRVADKADAKIAVFEPELNAAKAEKVYRADRAYCAHRKRPLLLIHLFKAETPNDKLDITGTVATLSFCMPPTNVLCIPRTYQANKVYQRQIEMFINQPEDDDVILDEAVA